MADAGHTVTGNESAGAATDWRLLGRLTAYLRPYWYCFAVSVAGFGLFALGMVLLADLLQYLLDVVAGAEGGSLLQGVALSIAGDTPDRIAIPATLLALTLLRALGLFLGAFPLDYAARCVVFALRAELFDKLCVAPLAELESQDRGAQLSRMTYVTEQVTDATREAVQTVLREGLLLVGLLGYMLYLNWRLTLIVLVVAPPIALLVRWAGRRFRLHSRRVQESMAAIAQQTGDALRGQRDMRAFAASDYSKLRFARDNSDNLRESVRFALLRAVSTPVVQLLLAGGLGLMLWFALGGQLLGSFSAGALAAYLAAAVQTGKPVRQLSAVQGTLQRGLAAVEEITAQLDREEERDTGTHVVERAAGALRLDGVSFTYPGADRPALADITLAIPAGATVGIVGRSGAGKSTLVDLLLRFIAPDSGCIYLDEVPLTDYTLANLREQFALVNQSPTLFTDTIANNIAMAAPGRYGRARIEQAASAARAMPFIAQLPQGLETRLANNGEALSGGERQRLALARALLKDAPVLVIDEGTAALDADTETRFRSALAEHTRGRTTIIIAHRMATIAAADIILVMDGGRLVEQGAHPELAARSPLYQTLCRGELAAL